MEPAETDNPLKLGKGSRITIAIVSFVSALMILPIALDPPNELGIINFIPPVFCLLIVGACISPKKIRGYCGDIIAFFVIVLAIWFYVSTYPNPEPGTNPIGFALIFGVGSVCYLWKRYGRYFIKKGP